MGRGLGRAVPGGRSIHRKQKSEKEKHLIKILPNCTADTFERQGAERDGRCSAHGALHGWAPVDVRRWAQFSRRPWCRCAWAAPRSRRPAAVVAAMPAVEAPHASCRGARRRGALCVRVGRSRAGCARWVGARCARCFACSDLRASSNTAPRSPRLAVQMVPRRPPRGSDLRDQGADRADGAC